MFNSIVKVNWYLKKQNLGSNGMSKFLISKFGSSAMSIKDRLKDAYKNIAYSGDKIWYHTSTDFQKANLDLYIMKKSLSYEKITDSYPRYVTDTIPESKLALYHNFKYNKAREQSYNTRLTHDTPLRMSETDCEKDNVEPWMLAETDDLYVWYLNDKTYNFTDLEPGELMKLKCDDLFNELYYESPFLETNTFVEKIMKLQLTSDSIKKIWSSDYVPEPHHPRSRYKSPFGSYFLSRCRNSREIFDCYFLSEEDYNYKDIKYITAQVRRVNAFKEQNIEKIEDTPRNESKLESTKTISSENNSEKRLYSAVLQGKLHAKSPPTAAKTLSQMSMFKCKIGEENEEKTIQLVPVTIVPDCVIIPTISISRTFVKEPSEIAEFVPLSKKSISETPKEIQKHPFPDNPVTIPSDRCNNSTYAYVSSNMSKNTSVVTTSTSNVNVTYSTASSNYQYPQSFVNYPQYYNSNYHQSTCMYSQFMTNRGYHRNYVQNYTQQYTPSIVMVPQHRTSSAYPSPYVPQPQYYNQMTMNKNIMQNYLRPTTQQRSYMQYVPSPPPPPAHWVLPSQQQVSTYLENNKVKSKLKKTPQVSVPQAKPGKKPQQLVKNASEECTKYKVLSKSNALAKALKIDDVDDYIANSVDFVFKEDDKNEGVVPVQVSMSEVLEIQALEQYHSSNDNVFQELERQAAEQYDDLSENWKSPLNSKAVFGGHCELALVIAKYVDIML